MEQKKDKKQQVKSMFNSIAFRYDFLNHFLSLGIDYSWRKKVIKFLGKLQIQTILDVATGTGDLAIAAAKLHPKKIIGIDIAGEMIEIGRKKIAAKKLNHLITLEDGDSENLRFEDKSFDAVMAAFGVRNFENLENGLAEMFRVLKNNGIVVILEFSKPEKYGIRQLYYFYFRWILPVLGRIISGSKSAYTYLPDSVDRFPTGNDFLIILNHIGFRDTMYRPLSFGIATLYSGKKFEV